MEVASAQRSVTFGVSVVEYDCQNNNGEGKRCSTTSKFAALPVKLRSKQYDGIKDVPHASFNNTENFGKVKSLINGITTTTDGGHSKMDSNTSPTVKSKQLLDLRSQLRLFADIAIKIIKDEHYVCPEDVEKQINEKLRSDMIPYYVRLVVEAQDHTYSGDAELVNKASALQSKSKESFATRTNKLVEALAPDHGGKADMRRLVDEEFPSSVEGYADS
ncbi:hypothetical protein SLS60_010833 [Paraconiothyrium brasiliense]|uniref:Uncharacterized protein n=1 Tax=Paraconiothyrium brasiliense TaxID=300254 RepID=A0ABR3QM44_9PLEO